jgi:hypothetical protein
MREGGPPADRSQRLPLFRRRGSEVFFYFPFMVTKNQVIFDTRNCIIHLPPVNGLFRTDYRYLTSASVCAISALDPRRYGISATGRSTIQVPTSIGPYSKIYTAIAVIARGLLAMGRPRCTARQQRWFRAVGVAAVGAAIAACITCAETVWRRFYGGGCDRRRTDGDAYRTRRTSLCKYVLEDGRIWSGTRTGN